MKTKQEQIIEDYIQFAIDNGLMQDDCIHWEIKIMGYEIDDDTWLIMLRTDTTASFKHYYIWLLTSLSFIEAVVKGIMDIKEKKYWLDNFDDEINTYSDEILRTRDRITIDQAIAIRDDRLEKIINNLLNNEHWTRET